jgi:hypothetical protein
VAWGLLAVFAVSLVALGVLSVANGSFHQEPLADTLALLLAFTAFMVVGALIVAHRPGNAIGWLSRPVLCWRSPARWPRNMPSMPS